MSVVLYVIKNHVHLYELLRQSTHHFVFKPFKTFAVRALSDIRHSPVASCFKQYIKFWFPPVVTEEQ